MYRYEFAKRQHDKNYKTKCPQCNTKHSFNLYFDNENQTLAPEEFGKCDRINTCGYINRPESSQPILTNPKPKIVLPTSYISKEEVLSLNLERYKDPLSIWLVEKFGDIAKKILYDYAVFSVFVKQWNEYVPLFLLVDEKGNIRSGKLMRYHIVNNEPKRTKFSDYWDNIRWLHTHHQEFQYEQVAFGSHLIKKYPEKDIKIVESEKSSLILNCVRPQYIWLSTLSFTGLQQHLLPCLKGRNCEVIPDKGEKTYIYWKTKCEEFIEEDLEVSIKCSNFMEQLDDEEFESGSDIADFVIKKING